MNGRAGFISLIVMGIFVVALSRGACADVPGEGLLVRLDASAGDSVEIAGGRVVRWRDLSGHGADATAASLEAAPQRVEGAFGTLAGIHFGGTQSLRLPRQEAALHDLQVFVVWRQTMDQNRQTSQQRLLSSAYGLKEVDDALPGWSVAAATWETGPAGRALCAEAAYSKASLANVAIGCHLRSNGWCFQGDIGEILIYDVPLAPKQFEKVCQYLEEKWHVRQPEVDRGWVHSGPWEGAPTRISDQLPLSDQANEASWRPLPSIWDEFSEKQPDAGKWWLTSRSWPGSPPVTFDAANVSLGDGEMVLKATGKLAGGSMLNLPPGFNHTSSFVESREAFTYGYVEIRAKVANCSLTSALFLMDTTREASTEIDVFEIVGGVPTLHRQVVMSRHVMKLPGLVARVPNQPHYGAFWTAPFRFADDYHVYGLEWDSRFIRWYLDGVLLHRVRNTLWQYPLHVILDLEAQQPFRENVMEDHLPAEYRIDYVRVWTRGQPTTSPNKG